MSRDLEGNWIYRGWEEMRSSRDMDETWRNRDLV